jgi:hypothetical protein
MARYLLVAHQTAEGPELVQAAKELAAKDSEAHFTLLVPATPAGDLLTWEEHEAKDIARARAESAAAELKRLGLNLVAFKVGDADPVLAVDDEFLAGNHYETIVISTLPPGISRWVKMDAVSRLERQRPNARVIHVVAAETPATTRKTR